MEILAEDAIKILVAILCGGILGFEREYQNKSAGFRTIILITLGATVFTIVSQRIGGSDDRIAANIITGIGFIGAGVIFKGSFDVKGLTTAAVIWIAAAIGMTIGIANYSLAISLSLLVLLILSLFGKVEAIIDNSNHRRTFNIVFVNVDPHHSELLDDIISQYHLRTLKKDISRKNNQLLVNMEVIGNKKNIVEFANQLFMIPEIAEV